MSTSVETKVRKKPTSLLKNPAEKLGIPAPDRKLERALLALEDTCLSVLDSQFVDGDRDAEGKYWQQVFVNIATPVSLALMESKGPRHFHYHYRHRPENLSVLHPVLEDPIDMLALACEEAITQCQTLLVGISDRSIVKCGRVLETALQGFLLIYRQSKKKKP